MALRSLLLVASVLLTQVAAHGFVPWIIINGTRIAGWDVAGSSYSHYYQRAHVDAAPDGYVTPQVCFNYPMPPCCLLTK